MRVLVVMDDPSKLHPDTDTTLVIMEALRRRGASVDFTVPDLLTLEGPEAMARTCEITAIDRSGSPPISFAAGTVRPLSDYAAVMMRKDPPFDLDFFFATQLLERARGKTLLVNDPRGLRDANEKLYIFNFPEVIAPTRVTRSIDDLRAFLRDEGGQMIVKPLDGCGGMGVFHVRSDDRNTNAILESATACGTKLVMAQRYLAEARQGDKRILLLDGEPIGAVLRVPRGDETRGNLHVGGTATRTELSPRDLEICRAVGARCCADGLYFVGLDVIGGFLTEVNVTSPTGIQEIDRLDGVKLEDQVADWLLREMRTKLERWLPLIFLGLALASAWSVFVHPTWMAAGGSNYNWRLFETWIEAGRRSIVWYGQFPLWNPWTCGGQVYLANPQSLVTAPTFLLPLLFGTAIGLKLQIVAYLFCAYDGMFRLARRIGLELPGALLASVLLGSGGWLALHVSVGHVTFQGAALFPYLILFYLRALDEWEWVIPLGAIAAWVVALGGTSTPPMAIVLLTVVSTVDVIKKRSPRPYLLLVAAAAAAFLIGAIRMLPAFEFALDHPRHLFETDANGVLDFLRGLYGWMGVEPVGGKRYWFHEYGLRLSYLTPPLIIWSLTLKPMRRWWVLALVGGLIFAGSAIPYGPWWMLKHLPLFRDLRVPSRYGILMALALPIVCGGALDDLLKRLANPITRRRVAIAVVSLALLDGLIYDYFRFRKVFDTPMTPAQREGYRFYHVVGDWQSMLHHVMRGPGAIGCDEEAPLQRPVKLDEGDLPQAKLSDPTAGQVKEVRWTPNRIEVDVALLRPTQVWVNMNWNEHWKVNVGKVLMVGEKHRRDVRGGQLAVDAPVGTQTLVLRYRPTSFIAGAAVTGVGGLACLLLFVSMRRRRKQ